MGILEKIETIIADDEETAILNIMKLLVNDDFYSMYANSKFYCSYLHLHYIESVFNWNKNTNYRGAACTIIQKHHNYKINLKDCYKAYPKYKKIYNILFI